MHNVLLRYTQRTTHPLIDPRAWEAPVLQQYKISVYSPKIWEEMIAYYLGKDAKYTVGYETTGDRAETIQKG